MNRKTRRSRQLKGDKRFTGEREKMENVGIVGDEEVVLAENRHLG